MPIVRLSTSTSASWVLSAMEADYHSRCLVFKRYLETDLVLYFDDTAASPGHSAVELLNRFVRLQEIYFFFFLIWNRARD